MPGPAFLRGEGVDLHVRESDDLDFLRQHRNDPSVRNGLTIGAPENGHQAEQRFERHAEDDSGVGLLVVPVGRDEPVGSVVLFRIDDTHGTGEIACWIAPDEHGNGYATEATRLLIDFAVAERRLNKVLARAIEPNTASRAVLEDNLGLRMEGVQRAEKYVRGEHHDVYRYVALADEWEVA